MSRKKSAGSKELNAKKARPQKLGVFLAELREAKHLSLQRVAKETKISATFLYQIERGKRALTSPEFFNRLANFYDIDVRDLLKQAGYIPEKESPDEALAQAVKRITLDKSAGLKASLFDKLTFYEKIAVAMLYEKASGRKVLDGSIELFT